MKKLNEFAVAPSSPDITPASTDLSATSADVAPVSADANEGWSRTYSDNKILTFALEKGDPSTLGTLSKDLVNSDGKGLADSGYSYFETIKEYVRSAISTMSNKLSTSSNMAKAAHNLKPDSKNMFVNFIEKIFQTIMNFFNTGFQRVASSVDKLVKGEGSVNLWASKNIGESGITYGGAIGAGIAASFLVFILYKIVNKFRKKNTRETEAYAFNTVNEIITESNSMLKSLKNVYLIEGADTSDNNITLMLNARQPAIELTNFLSEGPKETDGKIISFFKKHKTFIKLTTMAVAGVAAGYVAYKNMPAGETTTNEKFSNAVVDADKYGAQWGSR